MIRRCRARRDPSRPWQRAARRAFAVVGLWLVGGASVSFAQTLERAAFGAPTERYAHGVLGDAIEYGALTLTVSNRSSATAGQDAAVRRSQIVIRLPRDHVFEDLEPRLVDLDLDGRADAAMVVETDVALGGALALYGPEGKITETPHIGRTNRWLAPIGAADLDGDGHVELAYVDRPHLARTIRVWRYRSGRLEPVAELAGFTNHRIGEDFITSGLRDCGQGPEMILADSSWRNVVAVQLTQGALQARTLAPFRSRASVDRALSCQ
jgi:hypothetical protein